MNIVGQIENIGQFPCRICKKGLILSGVLHATLGYITNVAVLGETTRLSGY